MHRLVKLILPLFLMGCLSTNQIKDFKSDGCTLFPDRSLIRQQDWCDCCFEHDIAYWQGGTEAERLKADRALSDCVIEKTGDENLAELMYAGVRLGGSPYFYNWYRWGYGWGYARKYKPLTSKEKKQIEKKLNNYFSKNPERSCK